MRMQLGLWLSFLALGISSVSLESCGTIDPIAQASSPKPKTPTEAGTRRKARSPLVRVGANGRYLEKPDGTPFFVIGHAEAFGFFFQKMNSKEVQARFLKDMKKRGENTIVVQVENENLDFFGGNRLNLEYPIGVYNEDIAKQFDDFLDLAEAEGIYVITYLWDTFNMDFSWDKSPYNVKNGGPCEYVSDMLTNKTAIEYQKKKFKWAIDRWGNRKNLLAWDMMNEIEWAVAGRVPANKNSLGIAKTASAEEMQAWVTEMGKFVKSYELERWGYSRLRTVSTNESKHIAEWMLEHPEIDVLSSHFYYGSWSEANAADYPIKAAVAVWEDIGKWLQKSGYGKPFLQTEHGPLAWHLQRPDTLFPYDDDYQHNVSWANWAAGAAGTGMRWPYPNFGFEGARHLNPLTPRMAQSLTALAKVSSHIDYKSFQSIQDPDAIKIEGDRVISMVSRDERQLIGWLLARDPKPGKTEKLKVTFQDFGTGPHEVSWYDDTTGETLQTDYATGHEFVLQTPEFSKHMAVIVKSSNITTATK